MILVYTTNDRVGEARSLAQRLRARLSSVEVAAERNAKYWPTSRVEEMCGDERVTRVVVLPGVPYADEIEAAYRAAEIPVESATAKAAESPPQDVARPDAPWPASMKLAPDQYAERFPSGPNVDLARAWCAYQNAHPGEELWRA